MKSHYQARDVAKILGYKGTKKIADLSNRGIIKPEVKKASGTGTVHLYSFKNILQFALYDELRSLGCARVRIRRIFDLLDENVPEIYQRLSEDEAETVFLHMLKQVDEESWTATVIRVPKGKPLMFDWPPGAISVYLSVNISDLKRKITEGIGML